MFKPLLLALAVGILGVTPASTQLHRPPNGTYVYELTVGGQTALTSTIVFDDVSGGLVETETTATQGTGLTVRNAFDAGGNPVSHWLDVTTGGATQRTAATITPDALTLTQPPIKLRALRGTTVLAAGENTLSFDALVPLYAQLSGGKPFTYIALNGGAVINATIASGHDARPADAGAGDAEYVLALGPQQFQVWYDPQTWIVDLVARSGGMMRLKSHTNDTTLHIAQTPTPQATPLPIPPATYTERAAHFDSSGGAVIAGVLAMPRTKSRLVPAIAFVHGSGAATRDGGTFENPTFRDLGNTLANNGVAVLRYDKRGLGDSTGTATEDWHPLGDDAKAAIAFLRKQPGIDPHRIFLLGHSEGGFIAPIVANDAPLRGIIVMAGPAIPMEQILAKQGLATMSTAEQKAVRDGLASYTGIDPAVNIAKVRVPMLLLQGGKDSQILASDFPRLVSAARKANRKVTTRVFAEDDHVFIVLPSSQKMERGELFVPHPLDPRLGATILNWMNNLK